ncbi:MAG: hypothetical protein WCB18_08000 [Thermoplasmata archaeon]
MPGQNPRVRDRWVHDLSEDREVKDLREQSGRRDLNHDRGTRDVVNDLGRRELERLGVKAASALILPASTAISGGVLRALPRRKTRGARGRRRVTKQRT